MNIQRWSRAAALSVLALGACAGCQPGYMKASDLESRGQGPSACAKSCEDIGMRMGALVLVGNDLPGCVCQPLTVQGAAAPAKTEPLVPVQPPAAAPAPAPPLAPPTPEAPSAPSPTSSIEGSNGAAAATTGYVVLAAAAVARQARQERQRQEAQQRNY